MCNQCWTVDLSLPSFLYCVLCVINVEHWSHIKHNIEMSEGIGQPVQHWSHIKHNIEMREGIGQPVQHWSHIKHNIEMREGMDPFPHFYIVFYVWSMLNQLTYHFPHFFYFMCDQCWTGWPIPSLISMMCFMWDHCWTGWSIPSLISILCFMCDQWGMGQPVQHWSHIKYKKWRKW
jgi:hypothetical protein